MAGDLSQRSELFATFFEHVASGVGCASLRTELWDFEAAYEVRGSSSGACDQRLRLLRVRRRGDRRHGRTRGVGSDVDLAWKEWADRACADDSVPQLDWRVL